MSDVQQLFQQYSQLRQTGHESQAVVQQLWPQIKALLDADKQALKAYIHQHENQATTVPVVSSAPDVPDEPAIRRIAVDPGVEAGDNAELVETFCLHCGRLNRIDDVLCYACGQPLDSHSQDPQHTQVLKHTTGLFYSDEFFGDDFVLSLTLRGDGKGSAVYELRPQEFEREIHIGRLAYGSEVIPDIDLSEYDAKSRGVSRLHLSLFYDSGDSVIRIVDRASANGTFVNGQRLHRNEVRVLRNSDEVRLGRLVLTARFYTPEFG